MNSDKTKILIVEDDKINSLVLNKFLNKQFDIVNAYDGYEAIETADKHDIDLILMDISLGDPEMDGIKAMHKIREMKPDKDLRFVAVTSFAMQGDKQTLLGEGFDAYLSKPVYKDQLMTTIERQLKAIRKG